ncbi:MAG TPA: response regulator transcription factor, partial [Chroococcidiopsis sp.]
VPYPVCRLGPSVQIQMRSPILNTAFTHLAYQAGLTVSVMGDREDATMPLLTDDAAIAATAAATTAQPIVWLAHTTQPAPKTIAAQIDLSITATQLREAIAAVAAGQPWGVAAEPETPGLSEREQEVLSLLAKGLRDRDIASELHISARTVKFHINNILTKLNARTRGHAIHQSIVNGWIRE